MFKFYYFSLRVFGVDLKLASKNLIYIIIYKQDTMTKTPLEM